jgi:methylglutaconyl-CoA hydratase
MESQIILTHIENRIGYITLNRPEKRNALSPQLIQELGEAFSTLEKEEEVKVVILKAEGKAFCAGADLDYIRQMQDFTYEENLSDSQNLRDLFLQIYEFPKVVIAQVEGHALAGGCGLVTVCDYAFSVPEALFGFTEVKIGFIPALVSVFLVEKINPGKAAELLLSGELISSEQAKRYHLITEVVEASAIKDRVGQFAEKLIANNSGFSMRETKEMLRSFGRKARNEALASAAEINAKARSQEDCKKGISAFLSKTKPEW